MAAETDTSKERRNSEWIGSGDDVLTLKVSGKIPGADLDSTMSRLD
jgi:hypothetical protein